MRFRVLMFCPQFRPVVGGAERQAERLARALSAADCQVTILTPLLDPDSPAVEVVEGVRIERFPLIDLSRRWPVRGIALLNIPAILWQVRRVVKRNLDQYDILHCHLASVPVAGAVMAARHKPIPVLCKASVADLKSDLGEIERTGITGYVTAWLIRRWIPFWTAPTQAVVAALSRAGIHADSIYWIPNGVDLPVKAKGTVTDFPARRFLYLGRLSVNADRDVPTLIRAFDRLAGIEPTAELAVVGDGDLYRATAELAGHCRHARRIHLPGFQTPEPWLEWADAFVLPSRREGLANALLEAMSYGLPCIANDIPSNREVLAGGAAGVLVPLGSEQALFEAMRRMAVDSKHKAIMGTAARTHVREYYSIQSVAGRYIEFYERLSRIFRP